MHICFNLFSISLFVSANPAHAEESYRLSDRPIFSSIYNGSVQQVERLLNQGTDPNEDFHGNTPLVYAIQNEKIEIVKLLVKKGANVNQMSKDSKTPLMETLNYWAQGPHEMERLQIINILLGAGADPNKRISDQAETPMTRALLQKQFLLAKRLKEAEGKYNFTGSSAPLLVAAKNGDVALIEQFMKEGIKPDSMTDGHGCTPLCEAVTSGQEKAVEALLNAGAKWPLNAKPIDGRSSTWADLIGSSKTQILSAFLEKGLSASSANEIGESLLMIAARAMQPDSVPLLISKGAKIDYQGGPAKMSALMLAAQSGNSEAVKSLLAAKANFWLLNQNGETAKVIAGLNKKQEIISLLSSAGSTEYSGQELPKDNSFVAELSGKDQRDVSKGVFEALSYTSKSLRFFSTGKIKIDPKNIKPDSDVIAETIPGFIYAVMPSMEIVKLDTPEAFLKLNLKLETPEHALSLTRFFDSPSGKIGSPVVFRRTEFQEFPVASSCLAIEPPPSKFGIAEPKVRKSAGTFKVDRFGLLKSKTKSPNYLVDGLVVHVTETVDFNGRYSLKTESVKTEGLSLRPTCFPR